MRTPHNRGRLLSNLANVGHVARMIRASLRHQPLTIEGFTVLLEGEAGLRGATIPLRQAHLVADLRTVLDIEAGLSLAAS